MREDRALETHFELLRSKISRMAKSCWDALAQPALDEHSFRQGYEIGYSDACAGIAQGSSRSAATFRAPLQAKGNLS